MDEGPGVRCTILVPSPRNPVTVRARYDVSHATGFFSRPRPGESAASATPRADAFFSLVPVRTYVYIYARYTYITRSLKNTVETECPGLTLTTRIEFFRGVRHHARERRSVTVYFIASDAVTYDDKSDAYHRLSRPRVPIP